MTARTRDGRRGEDGRRALLLGAGLVTPPLITYLLEHGVALTVAGNTPDRAAEMVGDRGQVVDWAAGDDEGLARLVEGADLVISLLPATMHPLQHFLLACYTVAVFVVIPLTMSSGLSWVVR